MYFIDSHGIKYEVEGDSYADLLFAAGRELSRDIENDIELARAELGYMIENKDFESLKYALDNFRSMITTWEILETGYDFIELDVILYDYGYTLEQKGDPND